VRRRLQPRSTAILSELRHRGQPCVVHDNAFDPAFPHRGCFYLLMRSLFSPAHGETRRDIEVPPEQAATIAIATEPPHVANHLHCFFASTSYRAMLGVSH
jgi:hypothetical protein